MVRRFGPSDLGYKAEIACRTTPVALEAVLDMSLPMRRRQPSVSLFARSRPHTSSAYYRPSAAYRSNWAED